MKTVSVLLLPLLCAASVWAQTPAAPAADAKPAAVGFVAGLKPYERPAGAPQVADTPRSPELVKAGLFGVSEPIPGNLTSIVSTGNWFVPLRKPGMTPPYDIRGWHQTTTPSNPPAKAN